MKGLRLLSVLLIMALLLQTTQIPGVATFTSYAAEDAQQDADTSVPTEEEVLLPQEGAGDAEETELPEPAEGEGQTPGDTGAGEEPPVDTGDQESSDEVPGEVVSPQDPGTGEDIPPTQETGTEETAEETDTIEESEGEIVTGEEITEATESLLAAEDMFELRLQAIRDDNSLSEAEKEDMIQALKFEYSEGNGNISYKSIVVSGTSRFQNEWLEIAVNQNGIFTIGTKEGNPNYNTDNNKKLLFGHPSPWSSETLLYIEKDGRVFQQMFRADKTWIGDDGETSYATMELASHGITVTQTLRFVEDTGSGRKDTVKINYNINNDGDTAIKVGVRIMLDTMLNQHDDAPFKIVGIGNMTKAREFTGDQISQTYMVYDDLDYPTTYALGTLWQDDDRRPDKVQFCSWAGIKSSLWDYQVNPDWYFGDSAVGIYFNPVSIGAGSGTEVNTYYGTNLDFVYGGMDGADIDVSQPLKDGQLRVIVTNAVNKKAVSGAKVTMLPDDVVRTTDARGNVIFEGVPKNAAQKSFTIEREDYKTVTYHKSLPKNRTINLQIKKTADFKPLVESVTMTSSKAGSKYNNKDLMAGQVYFNSNKTDIKPDQTNTEKVKVIVKCDEVTEDPIYRLWKNNDPIQTNDTGVFELDTIIKDKNGNSFSMNRICGISEGDRVYVSIVDKNGIESAKKLIGIKVSLPSSFSTNITDKVKLTETIKFKLPNEDIMKIFLGEDDYRLAMPELPLEIEMDEDGKVRVALNLSEKKEWFTKKELYQEMVLRRHNSAMIMKNVPRIGAGNTELKIEICGYGEGQIKDGGVEIELGIIVKAKAGASYTTTFFAGVIPLYIKVGVELSASGQFGAKIIKDNKWTLEFSQGKFEPSFSLYAELGAGVSGLLSGGVQGKGTLKWMADLVRNYHNVTLQAKASVEVHLILYHNSFEIAQKTWTLYDSNNPKKYSAYNETAVSQERLLSGAFDITEYEETPRDYQNAYMSTVADTVENNVYIDARPVVVSAGGKAYRFWLEDDPARDSLDRTRLVYAVKTGAGWSEARPVHDDGKADYGFDVHADGSTIHITIQHSNRSFTGTEATTEILEQMLCSSEIYYAALDTSTDDVSEAVQLTDNDRGDFGPRVSSAAGKPYVAWYTNENNMVISNGDNTDIGESVIRYVVRDGDWSAESNVSVGNNLVTNMDIGFLAGEMKIAYTHDSDGNLATLADRELYLIGGLSSASPDTARVTKETYNATADEKPRFVTIKNVPALVWYQDNNVVYTTSSAENAVRVFAEGEEPNTLNGEFAVVDGTVPYVIWTGVSGNSLRGIDDDLYLSIYASRLNGDIWSPAFEWDRVADVADPVIASLSGYTSGSDAVVTYHVAKYNSGNVELSQIRETEGSDVWQLELLELTYDENDFAPEGTAGMELTLRNAGNEPLNNLYLDISGTQTLLGISLSPGEAAACQTVATLPAYEGASELKLRVLDESGQAVTEPEILYAGYTDLSAETAERALVTDEEFISILIENKSNVTAENVNVKILADDHAAGAIVYDQMLEEPIAAKSSYVLLCPMSRIADAEIGYIRVSTTTEERNKLNNEISLVLDREIPTLKDAYLFTIVSENGEAGTILEVDDMPYEGSYVMNDRIPVRAVPKTGFRFSHWESDNGGMFDSPQSPDTVFVMPQGDVTVTACFVSENTLAGHLALSPDKLEIGLGEGWKLNAVMTPSVAGMRNEALSWSSSDPAVAEVDYTGYVTATGYGTAVITARFDENIVATCNVTVGDVSAERIRFIYPRVTLNGRGDTRQLELMVMPRHTTAPILYSVENESILEVDENGFVRATGLGVTNVYATTTNSAGTELCAACEVSVVDPVRSIMMEERSIEVEKGYTDTVSISVRPSDATNIDEIEWTVVNPAVAEVTPAADNLSVTVKGLEEGITYIRAAVGDIVKTCKVNVYVQQSRPPVFVSARCMTDDGSTDAVFEIDTEASGYEDLENVTWNLYSSQTATYRLSSPSVTREDNEVRVHFNSVNAVPEMEKSYYISVTDGFRKESERTEIIIGRYRPFEIAPIKDQIYTGKEIRPDVKVLYQGTKLKKGTDYTLTYESSPVSVGTPHYVTITGVGSYEGLTQRAKYFICYDLSKCKVNKINDVYYTGEEITPYLSVYRPYKVNKKTQKDYLSVNYYEAVYTNNVKIGKATVSIVGVENSSGYKYYTGTKTASFKITKRPVNRVVSIQNMPTLYYTGSAQKPNVMVYDTGLNVALEQGKDYTISYSNNVNRTTNYKKRFKITIRGKGIYSGSYSYSSYINAQNIANTSITVGSGNAAKYNDGKQLKPPVSIVFNGKKLKKGKDYTVSYDSNKGTEEGMVHVSGKGNFIGYVSLPFRIVDNMIDGFKMTLSVNKFAYTGEAQKPVVTLKKGSQTLVENEDYVLSFSDCVNAGTVTVTATGINGYGGTKKMTYKIVAADVSKDEKLTVDDVPDVHFTGYPVKPEMSVRYDGKLLVAGRDYSVKYSANTKATRNAKATITMKGNFKGKKTVVFGIVPWDFNSNTVDILVGKASYTGKAVQPKITVSDTSTGEVLKAGSAYRLEYHNNQAAGAAQVKVIPVSMAEGSVSVIREFTIRSANASEMTVSAIKPQKYTGSEIKPKVTVKFGGKTLKQGVDYDVVYRNNITIGKAYADIIGKGNFRGTKVIDFAIKQ